MSSFSDALCCAATYKPLRLPELTSPAPSLQAQHHITSTNNNPIEHNHLCIITESDRNMYHSIYARTLEVIQKATDADFSIFKEADQRLSTVGNQKPYAIEVRSKNDLECFPLAEFAQDDLAAHVARLALAITFLRERGLSAAGDSVSDQELACIWDVLRNALETPLFEFAKVGRSHQGFLSLPLSVLLKEDGSNVECWRLHVWLPSVPQLDQRLVIHSHKSYGQSWILAGEAENTMYDVTPATDDESATNAIYRLDATTNKTLSPDAKEVLTGSVIHNTGKKVVVKEASRNRYHHGQSYVVPENAFHTTDLGSKTILGYFVLL